MKNKYNPNIEAIGFVVYKDYIEITNPCKIPFNIIEMIMKKREKEKRVNNIAYNYGIISLKIPKDLIKEITGRKNGRIK